MFDARIRHVVSNVILLYESQRSTFTAVTIMSVHARLRCFICMLLLSVLLLLFPTVQTTLHKCYRSMRTAGRGHVEKRLIQRKQSLLFRQNEIFLRTTCWREYYLFIILFSQRANFDFFQWGFFLITEQNIHYFYEDIWYSLSVSVKGKRHRGVSHPMKFLY